MIMDIMKRIAKHMSRKRYIVSGVLLVAIFGTVYLVMSSASPVVKDCGSTTVTNYTYQVPFGNAVWNQKVCNLPRYGKSAEYAQRFFKWSGAVNNGSPEHQAKYAGKLGIGSIFEEPRIGVPLWARNVYYSSNATTTTKVRSYVYSSNLDGTKYNSNSDVAKPGYKSKNPETTIPWNPDWGVYGTGDNEIIILDEQNGRIIEIWGFRKSESERLACANLLYPMPSNRICTASTDIGRDIDGNIIDYRTFEGLHGDRGVGFSKFITFTTPREVLAGEIRHALGVVIPNTAIGPICTKEQLDTSAEGNTCGTAVAPATKVEHGHMTSPTHLPAEYQQLYGLDKTIPEGMRFALDISNQEIEAWISSKEKFNGNARLAETARIFVRALRDYGFMIVDTNGSGAGIQAANAQNSEDKALWNQLGIYENKDAGTLLEGLIKEGDLYVVDPPTLECKDGTLTKHFCTWRNAYYPNQPVNNFGFQLEAENGTSSGGTSIINDPSASGNQAVQF